MSIDITNWLRGLGLEEYAEAFRDNDIDGEVLPELTGDDLVGLGIASVGHRRRLLTAIAALREPRRAPDTVPAATPSQTARSDRLLPAEAAPIQRRQLTILFCDLVRSTELATRLDPEDLGDIIAAYHRRVSELVAHYGGLAARLMGDGVLAYFGYPEAHEDDAERAVRSGLAIVEAIAGLELGQPLEVRIGIATGVVVVGDLLGSGPGQEQAVVGDTPNLAARLQAVAAPGTVVVADGTRRQLGTLFEVEDLGLHSLKGFAGEQRAWRITRESGVQSRFVALRTPETPLIGREEELELLLRRWQQAKTGEGRVVLLSAEAGIGKSRLAEALVERIAAERHARLRYFCSPYHQDSALFPITTQLEGTAGLTRTDTPAARLQKLAAIFDGNGAGNDLAVIAELWSPTAPAESAELALSPQRKKALTFEVLLRQLEAVARQKPVLIVFEDLHWIDPTTRELLDRLIARIENLPILLIATFRPEFQPYWAGQPHVTLVALTRLARREGAALVGHLLAKAAALPPDIVEEIIERTDGVPLFLEEVAKVVLEAALAYTAGGAVAVLPSSRLAVPPTLQASLMARLDRLGPAAREIAQVGAAIGREFSYELLLAASPRVEAETREALDRLIAAGLVFQSGTPPTADYQFKHSLVQEIAYGSLLRSLRQPLHARIAAAMRERSPDTLERAPEIFAYHLSEAGDHDSAAAYWLAAGRRSSGRSANLEAAAHLARGIASLRGLAETPERMRQELALQLALGPMLLSTRGYADAESSDPYRRAAELAARLGDDRARFAATWGLWITTHGGGRDDEERLRYLGELEQIADRVGDPELSLQAHHSAWATWIWCGEFVRSQQQVQQGFALYDPEKHRHHALLYGGHDPGVCGKGQGGIALWALGYPDQAAHSAGEGVALAEALHHVPSLLHALWFAAAVAHLRRDPAATLSCGERLLMLGREHGLKQYQAVGAIFRGWALTQTGNEEEGLAELRLYVGRYGAAAWTMLALFHAMLAEAELRAGHVHEAKAALVDGEETGNRWWRAELLRLCGDLQRSGSAPDGAAAEQSYRRAIAVARGQRAKSLELRAATSLARLLRDKGKRREARELLAPVLGWFTEGSDTADLAEAQVLLTGLGAGTIEG
jgi:class 3 adenylate cyclase/predicted ATPase